MKEKSKIELSQSQAFPILKTDLAPYFFTYNSNFTYGLLSITNFG